MGATERTMRKSIVRAALWAVLVAWIMVGTGHAARAASGSWTGGASDGLWATIGNWTGASPPAAAETATFNGAGNGFTLIGLGVAGVSTGTIVFDTASAAAYTIGDGGVNAQTLT